MFVLFRFAGLVMSMRGRMGINLAHNAKPDIRDIKVIQMYVTGKSAID